MPEEQRRMADEAVGPSRVADEAQQQEPWTADGRLKPHAIPAATTPDIPSMTGGFDASIEIPDLPADGEQAAPVDWQAIVKRRERELKKVGEARHRAEAAIVRVRTYAQNAIDAGDTGPGVALGRLLLRLLDGPADTTWTKVDLGA